MTEEMLLFYTVLILLIICIVLTGYCVYKYGSLKYELGLLEIKFRTLNNKVSDSDSNFGAIVDMICTASDNISSLEGYLDTLHEQMII